MAKYDVITVGSSTIDVFIETESELIKIMTSHSEEDLIAYPVGSKILINEIQFLTGGGGTNTACSLSRLGLKTAYLGKCGNDENGDRIIHLLKKEKVDFLGARGKQNSGFSIVMDSIEDDRTILTHKGANNFFSFKEVDKKKLNCKWFYFAAMTAKAYRELVKVARFADKEGIKIAFNPSCYLAEQGVDFLKPILDRTSLLVLNKEEAEILVGKGDTKTLLKNLQGLGPEIVVITDGKKGANALYKNHIYFVPACKIKVKETTGAGDAFASSFLAGLMLEDDVEFALKLGSVNSASVCMYSGAKEKLLNMKEAKSSIKKMKLKVKKSKA